MEKSQFYFCNFTQWAVKLQYFHTCNYKNKEFKQD